MVVTFSPKSAARKQPAGKSRHSWLPSLTHRLQELWAVRVPVNLSSLRAGAKSVKGNYRLTNEDRCLADVKHGVFMVADGIGAHPGGAEAAEIVLRTVAPQIAQVVAAVGFDIPTIQTVTGNAIQSARREMVEIAGYIPDFRQMGATVALAFVVEGRLCVSNIGDCRVYLLHDRTLTQLTVDQTFVQVAIDSGVLTPEQARKHPWRHVVTNAVGVRPLEQPPDLTIVDLAPGDRILLCSDGLTGAVGDRRLRELLLLGDDPQTTVGKMIDAALANDSRDNVTCVVFDIALADQEAERDERLPALAPDAA